MDVVDRMVRASAALDVVRAVGELERAASYARDGEDAAIVIAHANAITKATDRVSLLQRIETVRTQMTRRLFDKK